MVAWIRMVAVKMMTYFQSTANGNLHGCGFEGKEGFPKFLTYTAEMRMTREKVELENIIQSFSLTCYIWDVKYMNLEPRGVVRLQIYTCELSVYIHGYYKL